MHFSALYGILDKAVMSMDLAGPVTQEAGGGFQRCISIALSPDSCSGGDFWAVLPGPVIWAVLFVINSSVLWTGDLLLLSQICGYSGPAIVDVYLSSPDGEVHDNVLVLGTNSNGAGEVETVDGGLQCIRIHTSTASSMEAVFSNVSVRRLRKFEIESSLRNRGVDPESHDCDRTIACLKFVACIPGHGDVTALSNAFQCSSQPGAPEILSVCPSTGHAAGGDSIALVGKRFKSGFKVRFFASTEQGQWESWATVNRDVSNQGAAVLELPQYGEGEVFMATKVQIEVRIGPEREPYISEPAEFTYLPPKGPESSCTRCAVNQPVALPPTPLSSRVHGGRCSPAPVPSSNSSDHRPTRLSHSTPNWGDLVTENLLSSLSCANTTEDLFPSNASNASSGILADIGQWADFPLFSAGESISSYSLQSPVARNDQLDFGDSHDWAIIQQVVSEFTSAFPVNSNSVARHLNSLVAQRCALLHEIYRKCYQKSMEVADTSPSYLMKRQLDYYLPLLQGTGI
eukprot:scpid38737/ scgid4807/ Putative transcription factor p65 homolog; XRel1